MTGHPPSVIYVGLQKTGSTFLRHYFYAHPEIHCSRHGLFFQTDAADGSADEVRARYQSLFTDDPFPASARVVEAGELIQIPAAVVRGLMQRHPSVGQVLAVRRMAMVRPPFRIGERVAAGASPARGGT